MSFESWVKEMRSSGKVPFGTAYVEFAKKAWGAAKEERAEDKEKIRDDLVTAFIHYQYRLENPLPRPEETEELMMMYYRSDAMFHRRVNSLVSGVMQILDKRSG